MVYKKDLLEHRKKMFNVMLTSDSEWKDFKEEIDLSVTHNGYQYSSISLSKDEAKEVVRKLREHFDI